MDHLSSNMNITSPLDETLDREVFLLMQGPSPDHMALEFKSLLNKLVTTCWWCGPLTPLYPPTFMSPTQTLRPASVKRYWNVWDRGSFLFSFPLFCLPQKRNFTDEANSVISTVRTLLDEHESSSDRATNVQVWLIRFTPLSLLLSHSSLMMDFTCEVTCNFNINPVHSPPVTPHVDICSIFLSSLPLSSSFYRLPYVTPTGPIRVLLFSHCFVL